MIDVLESIKINIFIFQHKKILVKKNIYLPENRESVRLRYVKINQSSSVLWINVSFIKRFIQFQLETRHGKTQRGLTTPSATMDLTSASPTTGLTTTSPTTALAICLTSGEYAGKENHFKSFVILNMSRKFNGVGSHSQTEVRNIMSICLGSSSRYVPFITY